MKAAKKILILAILIFGSLTIYAQIDLITRHNGEIIKGNVIWTNEYTVVYSYENETASSHLKKPRLVQNPMSLEAPKA